MMKQYVFFFLMVAAHSLYGQQVSDLVVAVHDVPSAKGNLKVALFNSPEGFPGEVEKGMLMKTAVIRGDSTEIVFKGVPQGQYVLAVFHDVNNNGQLDTNERGVPTEAIGLSNNPKLRFGPPKYERSVFELNNHLRLSINLQQYRPSEN